MRVGFYVGWVIAVVLWLRGFTNGGAGAWT